MPFTRCTLGPMLLFMRHHYARAYCLLWTAPASHNGTYTAGKMRGAWMRILTQTQWLRIWCQRGLGFNSISTSYSPWTRKSELHLKSRFLQMWNEKRVLVPRIAMKTEIMHLACQAQGLPDARVPGDCRLPRPLQRSPVLTVFGSGITGLEINLKNNQKCRRRKAFPKGYSPKHYLYQKVRRLNKEDIIMGKMLKC